MRILCPTNLTDSMFLHGGTGEGRARAILFRAMMLAGDQPIITGTGIPAASVVEGAEVYNIGDLDRYKIRADLLLIERPNLSLERMYFDDLVSRCSIGAALFHYSWNDPLVDDPRILLSIGYTEGGPPEEWRIPHYRWHPFMLPMYDWTPRDRISVLHWGNYEREYDRGLGSVIDAWKQIASDYPGVSLDIIRQEKLREALAAGLPLARVQEDLKTCPGLRLTASMAYDVWLYQTSRSRAFLSTGYTTTSQGLLEPLSMGVPSILSSHTMLPVDYPYMTNQIVRREMADQIAIHLREILDDPETASAKVAPYRDTIRAEFDVDRSVDEWITIRTALEGMA